MKRAASIRRLVLPFGLEVSSWVSEAAASTPVPSPDNFVPSLARGFPWGAKEGHLVSQQQDDSVSEREINYDGGGAHSASLEISNTMVRLYKEQFGRGPTKTRTHWCGDDLIVVTMEDTLTPAERNLARMGEHQRLRDLRLFFQYASVREFCEPVEAITGRKVRAFFSAIDTEVDGMSIETFVLWPKGEHGRSRVEFADL